MASATLTQCINRISAIATHLQETQQEATALELHECLEVLVDLQQKQQADAQERHEWEQALHKSLLCNRLAFSIATSRIYGLSFEQIVEGILHQIHSAFPNWRIAYSSIDAQGQLMVIQSLEPEGMLSLTGLRVDLTVAPDYLAALRRGEPIVIEDVAKTSTMSPIAEVMLAGGSQAVLDLPLKPSRQLVGLLCLDSPQPYCWNEHEIGAMIEIADYVSYALQEVYTQQERQQVEGVLYQANHELKQYAAQLEAANQEVEITLEELHQGNEELMVAREDTERQRQRYQDLFNFAPDGYLVTDASGVIQAANQAARRLLATSHDIQILGKPLSQFIPLEERRVFRSQLNQLSRVHQPIQLEINLQPRQGRREDGETGKRGSNFPPVPQSPSLVQGQTSFSAAITATAFQDWQGERDRFFWLIRDISDKKRAELALQQLNQELEERVRQRTAELSEANAQLQAEIAERLQLSAERSRLIAILEASADYIATATSQGNILWNNPQLKKIRGLSLDADVTHLQIADYHPQWALDIIQQQGIPAAIRDGVWLGQTALLDEHEQEIPVSQMILAHKSADRMVDYLSTVMRDISDQKRAEIALHQREQEFRALVENSPDHVARLDRDGRILYINPAATQITGWLPEHYIGKTSSELGMPEDCDQLWTAAIQQVFETKQDVKVEFEYPGIQGIAYFHTRYVPEVNLAGEVGTVLAISRDITELKQTQAQLQETNNLLEAVIQSAPIAIDLLAPDGTVLLWNRMAEEVFGWSVAEVIGKLLPTISDAQQHEFQEFLRNTVAGKTLSQVETRRQHKDGSWVDIRLSTAQVKDAQGRVIGAIGISQNISEQQAALRARQQAEQHIHFQARLLDAVEQAVIATDLQGNITYWNRFAEVLYGWKADEVLGRFILDVTPASTTQAQAAEIFSQLQAGESWSGEFLVRRRDGTRFPIMITDSPIYDDRGILSGIVGISIDMSKLKQAEAALRESEELFRQLAENIRDVFFVYSGDLQLLYVSPAYEEIWGNSLEYQYTHPDSWLARIHPDDRDRIIGILPQTNQHNLTYEYRIIRPDGQERWIRTRSFLIRDESGNVTRIVGLCEDFTHRKAAELTLISVSERLQYLLTSSPAVIFSSPAHGDYTATFISPNVSTILGYEAQEFINSSQFWTRYVHPDDLDEILASFSQIFEQGSCSYEYRFLHADGTYHWLFTQIKLVNDAAGNPLECVGYLIDINDRKLAEENLWKTQQHLQAILDYSPSAIYVIDRENNHLLVSRSYETLVSISQENLIGKSIYEAWPSEFCDAFAANNQQVLQSGKSITFEEVAPHADGVHTYITIKFPLYDANRVAYAVCGMSTDISDRKQAEEELQKSQHFIQKIADASPNLLYLYDLEEQRNIYVNREITRMLGYSPEEVRAMGKELFPILMHPDDLSVSPEKLKQIDAAFDGEAIEFEYRMRHQNGEWRWLYSWDTVFARNADGKPKQILGTATDISDRKHLELALQQSEERFRTCVENLLDPLAIFSSIRDATGQIVDLRYEYINPAGCQSNRMPQEAMLGKPMCELFPVLRDVGLFDAYSGVVETGESLVRDSAFWEVVSNGQQFQLFFDIQAVKLGDGLMVTWRDVTERKRAEEQIQASLQEKEVLLKEIHHRVKNNLQVILSLLKLQSSYTDDAKTLQMFQESQNRIRSMALIHELLYHSQDLARIDFGSYIHTLVNQLARTYTVSTGAISWEIDVEPPIVQLTIDTALPCGLLINELVSNALKYAFPAGESGRIKISLQACNNGELILVISDNGVGISTGLDFRHTDSLGLQLVCGTTAQLGGTIELDRTQGTTFTIRFKEVKYKARG